MTRDEIARMRAQEYFVRARDYDRRGLEQMAEHFYEMAYELDPESETLRKLLAGKYVVSGKYARALLLVKGRRGIDMLDPDEQKTVAHLYMKMGQFDRAAAILEQLTSLTGEERYSLGLIYEALGRPDQAVECYRAYERAEGPSIDLGMKVADLFRRQQGYARAESVYVALDSLFGQRPEVFNALGALQIYKGDTAKAIDFFRTAIMLDSTNHEAMRNIAQVFIQNEDFGQAIRYYEKMYNSGEMVEIYGRTLALLYYYNTDYGKAEELLGRFLSERPDDYEVHYYLGLVFTAQERRDLAEMELEKTVALRPDFGQAWQSLCFLGIKEKDWEKALDCARRFTGAVDGSSDAWRILGFVYSARKEYKQARDALVQSTKRDSLDSHAWFELGSVYERSGEREKAAGAFRTVLRINPRDDAAANYLGYMWAETGRNLDSARLLVELALEEEPENGAYLDSYAWIFYQAGNYAKALEYIRRALEVIDDDPIIYSHYGDILARNGMAGEAVVAYRRSLELGSRDSTELARKIRELEQSSTEKGDGTR